MRAWAASDGARLVGVVQMALVELEELLAARRVQRPLVEAAQAGGAVRVPVGGDKVMRGV